MKPVKIAIIGAGPAGIYTALLLENLSGEVHLFEQNKDIGEKLKTTGGGRMNVTNEVFSDREFSSTEHRWVERLFKNSHFAHRDKILGKLGIEYQWEKHRAILKSQDAVGEVSRLKARLQAQANVKLHLNTKIKQIKPGKAGFEIYTEGEVSLKFDRVVLTTGGMYRMADLGTTEHIYDLSKQLDHSITEVSPSLCPLIFKDTDLRQFSGISFVGRLNDVKSKKSVTDDLLITHFGISGPAALDFSALAADQVTLSFITTITETEFVAQFNAQRAGKNSIKKFLKTFLPQRLVDFQLQKAGIAQDFIADLSKQKLQRLVKNLFHYPLPPSQKNVYPGSWTTKGGVLLSEVKTKNCESKRIPHLYFAGEILDCNGLCGGYNISFAMISAQIVADDLMS